MEDEKDVILEVRKSRVLATAKTCPDAKRILKELFPEAFPQLREWKIGDHFRIDGTSPHNVYVLCRTGSTSQCLPTLRLVDISTGLKYDVSEIRYKAGINISSVIFTDPIFDRLLTPVDIAVNYFTRK